MWATTKNFFFLSTFNCFEGKAKETSVDVQNPALFNIFFCSFEIVQQQKSREERDGPSGPSILESRKVFYFVEEILILTLYKGKWTSQNDGIKSRSFPFSLALLYRFCFQRRLHCETYCSAPTIGLVLGRFRSTDSLTLPSEREKVKRK